VDEADSGITVTSIEDVFRAVFVINLIERIVLRAVSEIDLIEAIPDLYNAKRSTTFIVNQATSQ
jgi:hypothetical protein